MNIISKIISCCFLLLVCGGIYFGLTRDPNGTKLSDTTVSDSSMPKKKSIGFPENITLTKHDITTHLPGVDPSVAESNLLSKNELEADDLDFQEELPPAILEKALSDLQNSTIPPGFSLEGIVKLNEDNLQDTISIDELPPPIADAMRLDLEFRNENGYDKEEYETAEAVLSILNSLAGTSSDIPDLTFIPSALPSEIMNAYEYMGYAFQAGDEEQPIHNTVKRVFSKLSDNSILVIEETSLENGSATLTTEFVNTAVLNCPAIIVEKRNSNIGSYGQINWNTESIGYAVFQFNAVPLMGNLQDIANLIANANSEIHNCDSKERS